MITPRSTDTAADETSLSRDIIYAARYYLGGRRGLLVLAGLALVAGLALNWGWLVAAGIAPILVAVLPCVAMCALGLCMNRAGGKSCSSGAGTPRNSTAAKDATPTVQIEALDALPGPTEDTVSGNAAATPHAEPERRPGRSKGTTDG